MPSAGLVTAKPDSFIALAKEDGRSRMLRLTSLAPDIVEAILRGDEPEDLSLEKHRKDLPTCWREQRRRWAAR